MDPIVFKSKRALTGPTYKEVEMVKKFWESAKEYPVRTALLVVLFILCVGAFVLLRSNAVALAKQAAAPAASVSAPVVEKAAVAAPVVKAPVPAPIVAAPVVAAKEPVVAPQKAAEKVFTIRQVGGAEQIIKDWHNEAAVTVKLPVLTDLGLGWEDVHETDGKTTYWVAVSSDKGTFTFTGVDYQFDEGFVAVVMTETPESIGVTTGWNDSDEDVNKRHFNVWSEAYVVNTTMDKDQTSERILAEWIADHGKSVGFYVNSDGTVVKMKYDDAVKFNETHPALFPEQLPQTEGSNKSVIMTVTQVGSGPIMKDWKNEAAGSVKLPIADSTNWEGILKDASGKPVYLILISSDAGKVTFADKDKEFKTGFVAAFVTSEPESIVVTTGWNADNKNFNVWAQKFIVPLDEDVDEVLKEMLTSYKKEQWKPVGYAILSDGTPFEIK